jgi:peptidoglycan hydrolase CwlO-like protein
LGAGALALLFGTSAPSYVKTAFHRVRHNAKAAVPIEFEIDRARQEVADLEPAIKKNIEAVVNEEVEIEHLNAEILATRENLEKEGRTIAALRDMLGTGGTLRTGGISYTPEEVKSDLTRRFDHYKAVKKILADRQETLKIRKLNLAAAKEKLNNMQESKKALATKIEGIDARLKQIEATQSANEFNLDESALARVKKTVSELDKRLEVMARVVEAEGRFAEKGVLMPIEPGRDVVKEIDTEFGIPAKSSNQASTDKDL